MNGIMINYLRSIHGRMHDFAISKLKRKKIKYCLLKYLNLNKAYLVFTPDHGNIGDHAIALASRQFLQRNNIKLVELTIPRLLEIKQLGMLNMMNGRPIYINGGGNLGTLYPAYENMFREIIEANPDSNILILPNTAYYGDSECDIKDFCRSKVYYNARDNICVCLRENYSYSFLKGQYSNIVLAPDMVLSLEIPQTGGRRQGCLLCLRDDSEKILGDEDEKKVMEQLQTIFGENIKKTDMHVGHSISRHNRKKAVYAKIQEFRKAELVVTDRLHAMIFCTLTGTKCLVLNSKSHKMEGCYQWIQNLQYISFNVHPDEIGGKYRELPNHYEVYNTHMLRDAFIDLKKMVIRYGKEK